MIYVLWAARLFSSKFIFFPFVPHFHWTIFVERRKWCAFLQLQLPLTKPFHNYDFVSAEREDRYRGKCDAKFSSRQYELNYDADGNYFRSNLVVGFHFAYFFADENFLRHTFKPHKCETQWIRSAVHNFENEITKKFGFHPSTSRDPFSEHSWRISIFPIATG